MTWVSSAVGFPAAWPRRAWRPRLCTPGASLGGATRWRRGWPPTFLARPGRKHPRPGGLPRGLGGCPGQRLGEVHGTTALVTVLVLEGMPRRERRRPRVPQRPGQEGRAVHPVLAAPDHEAVRAAVPVLEALAEAFPPAQAAVSASPRHAGGPARQGGAPPRDFRLGEPGGRPCAALAADRGDRARKGQV
jgi:hypothetical protein